MWLFYHRRALSKTGLIYTAAACADETRVAELQRWLRDLILHCAGIARTDLSLTDVNL